jgi:hypothetical protein
VIFWISTQPTGKSKDTAVLVVVFGFIKKTQCPALLAPVVLNGQGTAGIGTRSSESPGTA